MRITVFGKGNVGGGLADLWERTGHQVTRLGRDGGDVSDADVVEARVKPSNLWSGDEEAREVVEQLNRDAGYDPVYTGSLANAARQESIIDVIFAIGEGMGEYVYRFAPIEQL
jgi:predicted dinucleotide-binding enzyme